MEDREERSPEEQRKEGRREEREGKDWRKEDDKMRKQGRNEGTKEQPAGSMQNTTE